MLQFLTPFIAPIVEAAGAISWRTLATRTLGFFGTLTKRLFKSKIFQGVAVMWGYSKITEWTGQSMIPGLDDVKAAAAQLIEFADGKIIGQIPDPYKQVAIFLNYWIPLSETVALLSLLFALQVAVSSALAAMSIGRFLRSFGENG